MKWIDDNLGAIGGSLAILGCLAVNISLFFMLSLIPAAWPFYALLGGLSAIFWGATFHNAA